MDERDLLGAWLLVAWTIEYPDGHMTQPFGSRPRGLILYSADGWMSAVLMTGARTPFASPDMRRVTREQRATAFDEYLSYAGRWQVEAGTLRHDVELSLNPQLIDTVQIREATLQGPSLTLVAAEPLVPSGEVRRHVLQWRRAD